MNVKIILTAGKSFRDYEHLQNALPIERQRKIAALIRDEDKLLSLAAGVLVSRGLPTGATVRTDEFGKPFAANYPDIHFSVSHTKGAAVFVKARSPIGIDVEKVKPFADMDKIAKRHFAPDEYEYCRGNSARFFEIWTKKEAFLKMTGRGLSKGLSDFSVLSAFSAFSNKRIQSVLYNNFYISICSETLNSEQMIFDEVDL
jgi:4'-phosphopantetheinyl transferase